MKTYGNVYSLGSMCRCADYLRMAGLRLASGPFDWIYCGRSFENVLSWCVDELKGFIEKEDLVKDDPVTGPKKTIWYKNTKTGFLFPHEFIYGREFNGMYDEVRAKYDRRIARFLSALRGKENVLLCYLAREERPTDSSAGEAFAKLRAKYGDHVDAICFVGDLPPGEPVRTVEPVPGLKMVHFYANGAEEGDSRIIKDEEVVAMAELSQIRVPGGKLSNRIMAFRRWAWRSKISRAGNKTYRLFGIPVWRKKVHA